MVDSEEHIVDRVDRAGRRIFGSVVGLVLGLAIGLVVAALTVGSGSTPLFVGVVALITLGGAVLGAFLPTPFLVLTEILFSVFS